MSYPVGYLTRSVSMPQGYASEAGRASAAT
jgi:hypothetical protein